MFNTILTMIVTILFVGAAHEAGHALSIILTHAGEIKRIVVCSKGVGIEWEPYGYGPIKRSVVSLSGSVVNILFAVIFYSVGLDALGLFNLVFGVVNLMPFPGSDGLRAFAGLKEWAIEART